MKNKLIMLSIAGLMMLASCEATQTPAQRVAGTYTGNLVTGGTNYSAEITIGADGENKCDVTAVANAGSMTFLGNNLNLTYDAGTQVVTFSYTNANTINNELIEANGTMNGSNLNLTLKYNLVAPLWYDAVINATKN